VDGVWATKSKGVGLIVHAISSKISNLCGPDPPTSQTDRQTDDMQSQYRTLHQSASCGKNTTIYIIIKASIYDELNLNCQS